MSFLCFFVWILCLFFLYKYQQVQSKNWKLNVDHCALEHHHPTGNYYIVDVIEIYKAVIIHRPVFTDSLLHPLFLTPKIEYLTSKNQVWYMKTPVGKNPLCLLNKQLTTDLFSLKGKQITDKTSKGITMSRMADALVSIEYGMKVFGHCDSKSYAK